MKRFKYIFLLCLMISGIFLFNMNLKQEDNPNNITVAFYNVENLFDTINDPGSNDEKFLPGSKCHWTSERFWKKIANLGAAIDQLGDSNGPEVIGLSEIENISVLEALIHSEKLKNKEYEIIHFESHDRRGIDVALLYKKNIFKPYSSIHKSINLPENKNFKTRDILVVSGTISKDTIHFVVNHWPSRLGGEESEVNRIKVAQHVRTLTDSLSKISKNSKIIVMGDFNDEPSSKSIVEVLNAKPETKFCKENDLYNPFYHLMKEGNGSYKYKGDWDLLDQIMISKGLLKGNHLRYKENSENVYDPIWMYYKESKEHGPHRTYMGNKYYGGYSDHFPVYLQLEKK